jgi:hypothetical protein
LGRIEQPGAATAVTVDDMKVFKALPYRFPGKGKRISVKTGKPAVGDLNSIMHVLLDSIFKRQDFGFFSL